MHRHENSDDSLHRLRVGDRLFQDQTQEGVDAVRVEGWSPSAELVQDHPQRPEDAQEK